MKNYIDKLLSIAIVLSTSLIIPVIGNAESHRIESDWLKLLPGYKGDVLGAELVSIKNNEKLETQKLTIAIPKTSIPEHSEIEEVLVVGQRPKQPQPLDVTYQWLDDYDNDRYGLVIHLKKKSLWPIRLYLHANNGDLPSSLP